MYKKCLTDNTQEVAVPVKTGTGIHLRSVKCRIYKVAFHFFPFNPMVLRLRAIGFFCSYALMLLCICAYSVSPIYEILKEDGLSLRQ